MGRIDRNYRFVMGYNGALIALGAFGLLPPAASAMLHNGSTILLSMDCLTPLLPQEEMEPNGIPYSVPVMHIPLVDGIMDKQNYHFAKKSCWQPFWRREPFQKNNTKRASMI